MLRRGLACAVGLHVGLVAALWVSDEIEGFGPTSAIEAIGVEIILAPPTADEIAPHPAAEPSDASAAAAAAVTNAAKPELPAALPLPESRDPDAIAADLREAFPETAPPTPATLSTADLVALAKERPSAAAEAREATDTAAAPLPAETAGGGQGNAYQQAVFETLSRRPPSVPPGQTGRVEVAFTIGRDGSVATVRIKTSSGSATLDQAVVQVVRETRFAPPPVTASRADLDYEMPYIFR
jgi:TonB family protein